MENEHVVPRLHYHKEFLMDYGRPPDLTVGQSYDISCAYKVDDLTILQILDDCGTEHEFDLSDSLTTGHFDVLGDYKEVWEGEYA